MINSELEVADLKIELISNISAINVEMPLITLSLPPTLEKIASTIEIFASWHGTNAPIWASNTIIPTCRMKVL